MADVLADEVSEFLSIVPEEGDDPEDDGESGDFLPTGEDAEEATEFEYDDMSPNLVPVFMGHTDGKQALREIARKVFDDFEEARESSQEYRDRMGRDWKLFSGELPPKDFPYTNSANAHVPLMCENMLRLTSRVEGELFGDFSRIYGVVPLSAAHEKEAKILEMHGNWQLREDIPDFSRQMSRAVLSFFVFGDVISHSFWDPETRRNKHEVLTPDDFFLPYLHVTTEPDFSDTPYYGKILRYYPHQLEARKNSWYDVDKVLGDEPPSWDDIPEALFRQSVAETTGISEPGEQGNAPYTLIHYEGWLTLPGQSKQRFCQVIMEHHSRVLLSFTIHEEPEWRDKLRFDRELQELDEYRRAQGQFTMAEAAYDANLARGRAKVQTPGIEDALRSELTDTLDALPPPVMPVGPRWMKGKEDDLDLQPEPPIMSPIRMFAHGVCIENMAGAHGLSFGRMQADFNRAANVLTSQFIDAGTLSNCWTLLTTDVVKFDTPFQFAPGRVNKVRGLTGQELKANIMELKPAPANPQMLQMANQIYEWSSQAVQSPAVLSGEAGKSGETFRGLSSRIEQATKQIAVPSRRFSITWLKQVLMYNGRLNAIHLPESQVIEVVDPGNPLVQTIRVDRDMYARGYKFSIRADLRFTSEGQKVQEKMELVQLPAVVPQLANNVAFVYEAVRQYLDARGDMRMIETLGPPPDAPQTPLGIPPPAPPGLPPEGGGLSPTPGGVPTGTSAGGPAPDGPPVPAAVA